MKDQRICSCFGHREVYKNIDSDLTASIEYAVSKGCTIFLTGGIGQFDALFASYVRSVKKHHPEIELVLVKPYFSNKLNKSKEFYEMMYDDILIPEAVMGVHYKAAIKVRNRWMVDQSDLIIAYVYRDFGGAYDTIKYAEKQRKEIINIG